MCISQRFYNPPVCNTCWAKCSNSHATPSPRNYKYVFAFIPLDSKMPHHKITENQNHQLQRLTRRIYIWTVMINEKLSSTVRNHNIVDIKFSFWFNNYAKFSRICKFSFPKTCTLCKRKGKTHKLAVFFWTVICTLVSFQEMKQSNNITWKHSYAYVNCSFTLDWSKTGKEEKEIHTCYIRNSYERSA